MKVNVAALFLWCSLAVCTLVGVIADGGHGGHHVVFKIPEHIHTVKHTHTIYKTIHHHPKEHAEDRHSHGGKPFHWFKK